MSEEIEDLYYDRSEVPEWIDHWDSVKHFSDHIGDSELLVMAQAHLDHAVKVRLVQQE